MSALVSAAMGRKEYLVLAAFFLACGGFVSGILWLARRHHPLAEFRSFSAEHRAMVFKKLGFVKIGTNTYDRSLAYGVRGGCVVFRETWFWGIASDYYAVPLSRIRRIGEPGEAIIECGDGDVLVKADSEFVGDLGHSVL